MAFRLIPRDVKFLDLFAAAGQNLSDGRGRSCATS